MIGESWWCPVEKITGNFILASIGDLRCTCDIFQFEFFVFQEKSTIKFALRMIDELGKHKLTTWLGTLWLVGVVSDVVVVASLCT